MAYILRFCLFFAFSSTCYAQYGTQGPCVVSKDGYGQIITVCDAYATGSTTDAGHKQQTYLGSPYLTYPAWQKGTVQLEPGGRILDCDLTYDLVDNGVRCLFRGNSTETRLTPYAFTINGIPFARSLTMLSGLEAKRYLTVLHSGPTTLSKSLTSRLVTAPVANGYEKNTFFNGSFQAQERYYIQQGEARPTPTDLTTASLLTILPDQSKALAKRWTQKRLTEAEAIALLEQYDSLAVLANRNKPPLSADAVFVQFLRQKLSYPNQAWQAGVYGRVYVGFTVDAGGKLTDIVTLSPDNAGFGLDQAVQQTLQKLARVNPAYQGRYVLPVAFTYDDTQDAKGIYVPATRLPTDRYADRVMLTEHTVPVRTARPVSVISEVWGSYK